MQIYNDNEQMSQSKQEKKKSRKKIGNFIICFDELLGEGAIAKVYLCYNATNPEQIHAVKVIDKNKFAADDYLKQAIKRQFKIHSQLKHENIVELIDMVETHNNIYIIQELCEGKSMREVLQNGGKLSEKQVIEFMKQFCHGYSELVNKGVIHRDLKPDNILMANGRLKIADFGFSKQIITQKQLLTSIVGSPIYMAPQILKGEKYNSKCDVWSFGIIIFELLYGTFPWGSSNSFKTSTSLLKKILTEPLSFPGHTQVSQQMKEFIEYCLRCQENQRFSWLQIFQHQIFDGQFDGLAKKIRQDYTVAAHLLNSLASKIDASHLIGAFLQFKVKALDFKLFSNVIRWLIPEASPPQLSIMYEMFDKDCNGVIDIEEFVKAFQICDGQTLMLLNELIQEKSFLYEDLKEQRKVREAGEQKSYSVKAIKNLSRIIGSIVFVN